MERKALVTMALGAVLVAVIAGGAEKVPLGVASLTSNDARVRARAHNDILAQRNETVRQLIAILRTKDIDRSVDGPLHRAIRLLGEMRAAEAVGPLRDLLTYLPEGRRTITESIPSEAYYPATVALCQIGRPAINAMELAIRNSKDETERQLAAWVIMGVEGKEHALARMDHLVATRNLGKQHYQEAADYIRTYRPVSRPPRRPRRD